MQKKPDFRVKCGFWAEEMRHLRENVGFVCRKSLIFGLNVGFAWKKCVIFEKTKDYFAEKA